MRRRERDRAANAEYMRQYRHGNSERQAYDRRQNEAYREAMKRLRELHSDEFLALYTEERFKQGLIEADDR